MADKVWRRGQSTIKADTRRTMADGGQAPGMRPEHIAASPFSSKREPPNKLFGNHRYTAEPNERGADIART